MTQILLRTLQEVSGGVAPANGRLKATFWAGNRPASVAVDGSVVSSETFETLFVNGKAIRPIILPPTDVDKCVKWEISFGTQSSIVRYTTIPDSSTPVEFGELVIVDPNTYLPADLTPTLVQTITNIVEQEVEAHPPSQEQINEAVEAYLTANPIDSITQAELSSAISAVVDGAPGSLNTLNEIAAAIGDDPAFATTITGLLGGKVSLTGAQTIAGIKTFSSSPVVPDGSFSVAKTTGLQTALDGKALTTHTHTVSQITDFDAAIVDGVALIQEEIDDLSDIVATKASNADVSEALGIVQDTLTGMNTQIASKAAAVDLTAAVGQIDDLSDIVGTKANSADVAASLAGKANAADLDNVFVIANDVLVTADAAVPKTTTVAGKPLTSNVTLDKSDVGLGNVDNTTDASKPVSTATQTALNLKAPLASPAFTGTPTGITKAHVGLGNVDNTADSAKPISTAVASALSGKASNANLDALNTEVDDLTIVVASKAPLASPAFTGMPTGITKAHVGLGSVDNTADTAKPVSTAQASAIALKANLASPTFTGTVGGITKAMVGLGSVDNIADASKPVSTATQSALDLKAPLASPTFTGTPTGITKTHVGLGNVDNTSDANKPVSTAQQTALDLKAPLASPAFTGTPTGITKTHVGLGNIDNTSDANKPVSTAQSAALALKTDLTNLRLPIILTQAAYDALTPPVTGQVYIIQG